MTARERKGEGHKEAYKQAMLQSSTEMTQQTVVDKCLVQVSPSETNSPQSNQATSSKETEQSCSRACMHASGLCVRC